ncbi:hypothetical protein [Bifidobacterium angulatum]|uniref:hypothetical protein n=1 Tax=Bifidobacterium angulatum TaxID=1683 RepID=UPI003AAFEECA
MAATLEPLPKVMAVTCFAFVGGRGAGVRSDSGGSGAASASSVGGHALCISVQQVYGGIRVACQFVIVILLPIPVKPGRQQSDERAIVPQPTPYPFDHPDDRRRDHVREQQFRRIGKQCVDDIRQEIHMALFL